MTEITFLLLLLKASQNARLARHGGTLQKYRNVKLLCSVFANRKFRKLFKQGAVIYLGFHSFSPFENPLPHILYLSFLFPFLFIIVTLA